MRSGSRPAGLTTSVTSSGSIRIPLFGPRGPMVASGGPLSTAVSFHGGTEGSNPSSSSGESRTIGPSRGEWSTSVPGGIGSLGQALHKAQSNPEVRPADTQTAASSDENAEQQK